MLPGQVLLPSFGPGGTIPTTESFNGLWLQ